MHRTNVITGTLMGHTFAEERLSAIRGRLESTVKVNLGSDMRVDTDVSKESGCVVCHACFSRTAQFVLQLLLNHCPNVNVKILGVFR